MTYLILKNVLIEEVLELLVGDVDAELLAVVKKQSRVKIGMGGEYLIHSKALRYNCLESIGNGDKRQIIMVDMSHLFKRVDLEVFKSKNVKNANLRLPFLVLRHPRLSASVAHALWAKQKIHLTPPQSERNDNQ